MTNFTDNTTLHDERLDADERLQICFARSKRFWEQQSKDGAFGKEILYCFVFYAVQAGLSLTDNSSRVLADVMKAATDGYNESVNLEKRVH